MTLVRVLPAINATLNAVSGVLLATGFWAIRRQRQGLHRACMQSAVAVSALFLACYTARVVLTGTHRYPGSGFGRAGYLVILFSHMSLAMLAVPLVLTTLFLARRSRFQVHRRVARWTFPVWLYVSVTGVVVYVLLYHPL
jgi:putative membrane protein